MIGDKKCGCSLCESTKLLWVIDPKFLDTEEKIAVAWENLRKATEEDYKRFDIARIKTWEKARDILLD